MKQISVFKSISQRKKSKENKCNILIDSFSKAGITKNRKRNFWLESKKIHTIRAIIYINR